jgi:hypothetical protein
MNNLIKPSFINKLEDHNIRVVDLDIVTNGFRQNKKMIRLNRALQKNEKNIEEKKSINRNINSLWKELLDEELGKIHQDTNHKYVLLGLSTFHRNHKVRVKIDTPNKFFIKANPEQHAKEIVEYNLEKYKMHIVDGSFPIKFLDYNFLINQNKRLSQVYQNIGYVYKPLHWIERWLDSIINAPVAQVGGINDQTEEKSEKLENQKFGYVASTMDYKEYFRYRNNSKKRKISKYLGRSNDGYVSPLKWLAIIYSIPDSRRHFKKGFYKDRTGIEQPFIEEKYEGAFDVLKKPIYMYKVEQTKVSEIRWFKLKVEADLKILEREKIDDVYNELYKQNVKLVEFKY